MEELIASLPSPVEDWEVECSDDEKYEISSKWIKINGMEIPAPEDIASLHEVLCMDKVIALEWRSLGRRPKTPDGYIIPVPVASTKKAEIKSDDSFFDFDMDDLSSSQPKLPVRRREGELKGGARKKTASFDGVINNMKRFWKMENEAQPQNPS